MPMTIPGFGRYFVKYFKFEDNVCDELCFSQMDYKLCSKDQQQCTECPFAIFVFHFIMQILE